MTSRMSLRQILGLVLAIVLLSIRAVNSSLAPLHLKSNEHRIPGHYIVVLKDDVDVNTFTAAFEASVVRGTSIGEIRHTYHHAIKGFAAQLTKDTVDKLRESEHVKYIEENGIVHASNVLSWGLDRIDQRDRSLDDNAEYLGDGFDVHIYIIDTGTLSTHTQFTSRFSSDGYDAIDDTNSAGVDLNGHGTHCAGTAAGAEYGVAQGATVHSVRVLDSRGSGATVGVVAGMDYVVGKAPNATVVASMSLGGGLSTAMNEAIQGMADAGIVVSVAAGNENQDACETSPASAHAAITVGATDIADVRASFSNYGSCVDIFAPGLSITSAWYTSNTATNTISGTSMACPHVTGAVAALWSFDRSLNSITVTDLLVIRGSTPNKVSDPRSANRLLYIGKATCMSQCGTPQDNTRSCQCDSACASRGDCCTDYNYVCGTHAPTCENLCDVTDSSYPCTCDQLCSSRGDCCPDYIMMCNGNCNLVITDEGTITSPNYPSYYDNSQNCTTLITAPAGEKVVITFTAFDIEVGENCGYDELRIYDGSGSLSDLIGSFCGATAPLQGSIESSEENLFLAFLTDGSLTYAGYQATVTFTNSGVYANDIPETRQEPTMGIPEIRQEPAISKPEFGLKPTKGIAEIRQEPTMGIPEIRQEPTMGIPEKKPKGQNKKVKFASRG